MENSIFISGGASGIGAATVNLFLDKGWRVAVLDLHRTQFVEELSGRLSPDCFLFFEGDTRNMDAVEVAVESTVKNFGNLKAVFAGAGVHHSDTLENLDMDSLKRLIDINVIGTVNVLHAALPHIVSSGGGAMVINASDQSLIGKPHSFSYGLTKGALGQITKSLALDLASKNIRVNAVCPGTIHTPMVEAIFERCHNQGMGLLEDLWAEEAQIFPMKRVGLPLEVAKAVYFLASEESSFTTGTLLSVDGGLTAG